MKKKDNEEEKKHTSNLHKYLCNLDEGFININDYIYPNDICKYCKEGEIISVDNEGIMVCNKCAKQVKYLIENEKPSYKEPPKEVSFYAYKRINHFREILAQFQAKETTQIPDEVFDKIKKQIRKERAKSVSDNGRDLNSLAIEETSLTSDVLFATESLKSARLAVENSRRESQRQLKFVVMLVGHKLVFLIHA